MGWSEENRKVDILHSSSLGGRGRYSIPNLPKASRHSSDYEMLKAPLGGHGRYERKSMEPSLQFLNAETSQDHLPFNTCSAIPHDCRGEGRCLERNLAPRSCHPEPVQHAICVSKPVTPLRPWSEAYDGMPKSGCLFECMPGYHEVSCGPDCIMCYQSRDRYESGTIILCLFLACFTSVLKLHRWFGAKLYTKKNSMLLGMNCPAIPATETSTCCICLGTMKPGQSVRQLPCMAGGCNGHQFHTDCIDHWLERSLRCPLCNADCSALFQFQPWPLCRQQHASPASEPCSGSDSEESTNS